MKKGDERECDLVIESKEQVIFIELKKKALTRAARSGSDVGILSDISASLMDSQLQLFEHEINLRTQQKIELRYKGSSKILSLNGRGIEKISIFLDEYGAMQDRMVIHQVLNCFAPARFGAFDPKYQDQLENLSQKCSELLLKIEKLRTMGIEFGQNPFFNCWFLSAAQLLLVLDSPKSNDEFQRELWDTRHISFNSRDFYYERACSKKLKKSAAK